jgi:hypothetical protein
MEKVHVSEYNTGKPLCRVELMRFASKVNKLWTTACKITVICNMTQSSLVNRYRFGATCYFHLQGRNFYFEDGSSRFFLKSLTPQKT